jgi:molybdopterin-binding protein
MAREKQGTEPHLRIGEAAARLGVSPDTLRRWAERGRLEVTLTPGGQRTVSQADISRLAAERRREGAGPPIVAQSARNRFPGVVTRVERDRVAAVVEVQAGPHRLVSLITREASEELDLAPGDEVVCTVKATDVMVELPGR